jgi:type IV secretion system protein VirB4
MLKRHFNNALMKFESNWLLNFDMVKSQKNSYPLEKDCKFPDPTSFVIDTERRERYNQANLHFTNNHFIFLTYLPPNDAEATFADTFIVGQREKTSNYSRHLQFFQHALNVLESEIGAKLRLRRLTSDDVFSYLFTSITGELKRLKLYHPAIDLDYALGNFADVVTDLKLKVNNKYCRVLTLVDFPEYARPAVLHALTLLRFEFSWRTRYIILSTEDGDRLLRQRFKTWFGKRNTAKQIAAQAIAAKDGGQVENNPESIGNMDAEVHAMNVKKAILDNAMGKEKQGFCTSVIVVFDENLESLEKKVKEINRVLADKFFHAHEETVGAPMAYLGSLPAVDYFNVRMPAISTRYLADLIALDSVWSGLDKNPNPLLPEQGINNPPLIPIEINNTVN